MFCVTMTEMNAACYPEVSRLRYAPTMQRAKALAEAWLKTHLDKLPTFFIEIWNGEYNDGEPIWVEGQDFDEWDPEDESY